ncbi:hypothetical protein PHYSODRAFT_326934 [Phytophthora sojae]|uniref:DUF4371 domain-containing protein n=1 Tax=Phytophthora sojae (strain P6497) TaxID=1094619 RepID=G4YUR1_PHYSP|nr:hypothetical protein PHYSODRAFT_326934 [Phytophthora sojae]EGZ25986.1 hypothetical protein PHYSODRAFT_326934 [Phytophthora sojae]|eukprot:XP_009521274.1 hypothetical protein PHYSODRAFT_326934 [Phytophthora sojae]
MHADSAFDVLVRSAKKKRKKMAKAMVFKKFRRDHIIRHMQREHSKQWSAFLAVTEDEERESFFLRTRIEDFLPRHPQISFVVPSGIASLIERLFCNRGDTPHGLVAVDDEIGEVEVSNDFMETETDGYVQVIRDRDQFETIVSCTNAGVSFRAIAGLLTTFGTALSNMKLGSPCRQVVGLSVSRVVALNLSAIRSLLSKTWGFSLMVDGATHNKEGYLDVRVSFGLVGKIHNIHLLAIPFGDSAHTGENYAELVIDLLEDIGETNLLPQLIGISTDGAATMLGRHQGFSTRLRAAAEYFGNSAIKINWCGSHQLNLAVDAFLKVLDRTMNFRSRLGMEISFTRRYESVRFAVGLRPKYATTRWESIHDTCHFLAKHYEQLVAAQDAKNYARSSSAGWLCLFVVSELTEAIRMCFRMLQVKTVTMNEQFTALDELVNTFQLKYESNTEDGSVNVDKTNVANHLKWCSYNSLALFSSMDVGVQRDENAPEDQTHTATDGTELDDASPDEQPDQNDTELVGAVAEAITVFIETVSCIKLDINSDCREEPPTSPIEIIQCTDRAFRALLAAHSPKLKARFGATATTDIWNQRKQLAHCFNKKSECCRRLESPRNPSREVTLKVVWEKAASFGNSELLVEFAVGLASTAPGTHIVEGDFSTLERTMGPHRGRLCNYAMEGELQCRQYFELMSLADKMSRYQAAA